LKEEMKLSELPDWASAIEGLTPEQLEGLIAASAQSGQSIQEWVAEAVREKEEREASRLVQPWLPLSWRVAWDRYGRP
jgi:hypothetical protein